MIDERPTPAIGWFHVSYDIVGEGVHHHVQEAQRYRKLRFVWSLNAYTGERRSRFFIRGTEYPTLNDAIDAWHDRFGKRKTRVRL